MLYAICLLLVIIETWALYSEDGKEGLLSQDFRKTIGFFFVPLVVKVLANFVFRKKGEKKILGVFSTLLNRHRIIEIEYPDISDKELLNVLESYKSTYPYKTKILFIENGYLVLGRMNLWEKFLGENDDFYIEMIDSGFKIYLNSIGGKLPIYKFCEDNFGMR